MRDPLDTLSPEVIALVHQMYDPIVADAGLPTSAIDDALATFVYTPRALRRYSGDFKSALVAHLGACLNPLIRKAERQAHEEFARRERESLDAYLREHAAPGHADDWQYGWCS